MISPTATTRPASCSTMSGLLPPPAKSTTSRPLTRNRTNREEASRSEGFAQAPSEFSMSRVQLLPCMASTREFFRKSAASFPPMFWPSPMTRPPTIMSTIPKSGLGASSLRWPQVIDLCVYPATEGGQLILSRGQVSSAMELHGAFPTAVQPVGLGTTCILPSVFSAYAERLMYQSAAKGWAARACGVHTKRSPDAPSIAALAERTSARSAVANLLRSRSATHAASSVPPTSSAHTGTGSEAAFDAVTLYFSPARSGSARLSVSPLPGTSGGGDVPRSRRQGAPLWLHGPSVLGPDLRRG